MSLGGRLPNSYPEPQCGDNVMPERVTWPTPPSEMDSQSLVPPITQPQSKGLPKKNVGLLIRQNTSVNIDVDQSHYLLDKIKQIEVEQNSQDGAIPITQEELSIKVFERRSGYVTGLRMRPSSSSRSTVGHGDNIKYVTQLDQKMQEQANQIQEQVDKIQE